MHHHNQDVTLRVATVTPILHVPTTNKYENLRCKGTFHVTTAIAEFTKISETFLRLSVARMKQYFLIA
jgi:hypothetical protein